MLYDYELKKNEIVGYNKYAVVCKLKHLYIV